MTSSFFRSEQYAGAIGKLGTEFEHLQPMLDSDGGHGMIFSDGNQTYFTYHAPNRSLLERPRFCAIEDEHGCIRIK